MEIWPESGWWTEILAPYLQRSGRYYAATRGEDYVGEQQENIRAGVSRFKQKLLEAPEAYSAVILTQFNPPRAEELAPQSSADVVLAFRNLHTLMAWGIVDEAMRAVHRALKPDGVFCLVGHRAAEEAPWDPAAKTGYVAEEFAINLVELHGFRLIGRSEVNANARDTRDHPGGVWALPPSLAHGPTDRDKYQAIGESDRFTLKFIKLANTP